MTDQGGVEASAAGRRPVDALHPLLFAAYPVLFLWSQNLGETDPREVVTPIVVLVALAATATWLAGRLLGDAGRAALLVTPLAFGLLMYGHVARAVAPLHVPGFVQQAGWAVLVLGAGIAALRLAPARISAASGVLTRVGSVLVAITLVLIVPFQATGIAGAAPGADDGGTLPTTTTAPKRDVYWLIFDRYGSDRAHRLLYGLDNDLTPWLREQGFTVLDDSHANYVRTVISLAATMSMTHVADMPGVPPAESRDLSFLDEQIRWSLVARQFQALGYRYVQIGSWWDPTRTSPLADESLHLPGPSEFVSTLIDASALPAVARRLHVSTTDARRRHYDNNRYGLDALDLVRDEPGPKFVFGHVLLPHPPTVFDRDGSFMTADEQRSLSGRERYERQLAYTNDRLRAFLASLLALPAEQRPIVILQADEGPESPEYRATRKTTWEWAAATDGDLEIKYGILNAWYLPGGEEIGLYPAMTSINTFPTLFRGYFGLDEPNLPDRVYTSKRYGLPYDLTDVTDRLPSLR